MKKITILFCLITNNLISADRVEVMFKFEDLPATLTLEKGMSFTEIRKKVAKRFCLTDVKIYNPSFESRSGIFADRIFDCDSKLSNSNIDWLRTTFPLIVTGDKVSEMWKDYEEV